MILRYLSLYIVLVSYLGFVQALVAVIGELVVIFGELAESIRLFIFLGDLISLALFSYPALSQPESMLFFQGFFFNFELGYLKLHSSHLEDVIF